MSNYIKPTAILLDTATTAAATSSCSTSTTDAKELMEMLKDMGYDQENAFGMSEGCIEQVVIDDYCKFSSSIQVFFS